MSTPPSRTRSGCPTCPVWTCDTAKAAFEKALTEAKNVLDNPNATQAEVNTAWDNLLEGIWGLGLTQGNKDVLNLVIQRAEAMMDEADKYVEANWKTLVDALDAAKKVAEDGNAMQEDVDKATEALLNAILAQRYKADKSILEDLIGEAKGIDLTGYTAESVAVFQKALSEASPPVALPRPPTSPRPPRLLRPPTSLRAPTSPRAPRSLRATCLRLVTTPSWA